MVTGQQVRGRDNEENVPKGSHAVGFLPLDQPAQRDGHAPAAPDIPLSAIDRDRLGTRQE